MRRLVLALALAAAASPVTASYADPTCVEPYVSTPAGPLRLGDVCVPTSGEVDCRSYSLYIGQIDFDTIVYVCIPETQ